MNTNLFQLVDGVSFITRPGDNTPMDQEGCRIKVTLQDGAGKPYFTVYLPNFAHLEPENVLDPEDDEEPRSLPPGSRLCIICNRLGQYISTAVQEGQWRPFFSTIPTNRSESVRFENIFVMGYLDEIIRSPSCALCHLVSKTLEDCFGARTKIPLYYQTWKGTFRQQCALHMLGLVKGIRSPGLTIALSSGASILLPLQDRLREKGQLFAPLITLIVDDLYKLPLPSPIGQELAKVINADRGDINSFIECYKNCKSAHKSICEVPRGEEPITDDDAHHEFYPSRTISNLILIDVENMCIVDAPINYTFVALSYVWGQKPFFKLKKASYSILKGEYSLLGQDLPQTFLDAMHITQLLGERYLWIDALCIVQDDEQGKKEQILQMDNIFQSAELTIIAADSGSAYAGLTGLRDGSRNSSQFIQDIGGLRFAIQSPPLGVLMTSLRWHLRGWTYQEAMLSKRMLVFTPIQIYYHCNLRSQSEDLHLPNPETRKISQHSHGIERHPLYSVSRRHPVQGRRKFRLEQHWFSYGPLVEEFSKRDFSCESDVLKGAAGILKTMTNPEIEKYICGLPITFFEWGLLWHPAEILKPRGPASSGYPFPSWSWAGWVGACKMIGYQTSPARIYPVIDSWIFLTPDPNRKREVVGKAYTLGEILNDLLPYRPDATPIKQAMPFKKTQWQSWDKIQNFMLTESPKYQSVSESYERDIRQHQLDVATSYPLLESGVLIFISTSSTFSISSTPTKHGYKGFSKESTASYPINYGNVWVGTIHLAQETAAKLLCSPSTRAEFVLLSETPSVFDETNQEHVKAEIIPYGSTTFDINIWGPGHPKNRESLLANVMWINKADGISYRVGVGQIHIGAWRQSNPTKQTIILA